MNILINLPIKTEILLNSFRPTSHIISLATLYTINVRHFTQCLLTYNPWIWCGADIHPESSHAQRQFYL